MTLGRALVRNLNFFSSLTFKVIGVLLIVSFLVSLSYLIRYNSIDKRSRDSSSSTSDSSVLHDEAIVNFDSKIPLSASKVGLGLMARSESYNNITSHVSASHTNKDVYFVNPNQNYLVTFDDKQRDKTDKSQMKNKLQVSKKKSNETLPQHDSKKNLFILSIGSNNEFIKRIQMSNTNTTINE